ncbi:cell division protein FtsQ/DivIB [Neisseriaceae bacterium ESL0693]|nr:cell division protein FtsQ/DivIB [Neisseriaceae bacterium ESL0693]
MRLWDNAQALKRLYRWLYLCVALCLMAAITLWGMHSSHFPVRHIKVTRTLQHIDAADIQRISKQYLYGNIFTVNVNAAQQELAGLPWVAQVQVKRVWPDTIALDIKERVALARWHDGQLVDQEGELFHARTSEDLPVFDGPVKNSRAMTVQLLLFNNMLHSVDLSVARLHLNARSAWEIVLNNGILIRLGREHQEKRLARFIAVWPQVLEDQAANIEYVDMRYPDGFALRKKQTVDVRSDAVTATAD